MNNRMNYTFLKLFLCLAAPALCVFLILHLCEVPDFGSFTSHIKSIGYPVIIIFIPYIIIIVNDSVGWFNCFARRLSGRSLGKLITLRLATETLQTSLPGGAAYAELARPFLLNKHLKIGYTESIAANIITKVNILAAQVLFLIFGIVLLLTRFREGAVPGGFISDSILYPAAGVLIAGGLLTAYLVYNRDLILRIICRLDKLNIKFLRRVIIRIRRPASEVNKILTEFYSQHKIRLIITIIIFLLTWFLMAFESLLILRVIGIEADLMQTVLLESLISLIRMIFFFLPGAAGPQDAAVMMIFTIAGVPDPVLNSLIFVMLKRAKEIVWILTGYIVLINCGVEMKRLIRLMREDPGLQIKYVKGQPAN